MFLLSFKINFRFAEDTKNSHKSRRQSSVFVYFFDFLKNSFIYPKNWNYHSNFAIDVLVKSDKGHGRIESLDYQNLHFLCDIIPLYFTSLTFATGHDNWLVAFLTWIKLFEKEFAA